MNYFKRLGYAFSKMNIDDHAKTWLILIVSILVVSGFRWKPAAAQISTPWSPQASIPVYEVQTEEPPFLIADQFRTIHAFNSQPLDPANDTSQRVVVYRQWTAEGGWTLPNDVFFDQNGRDINLLDVFFDQKGNVHLLLQINGDEIYHTKAPLIVARDAQSWSKPELITSRSLPIIRGIPYVAAMGGNGLGTLVVIYSGMAEGNGTYALFSRDDGSTWSTAVPIYLTKDADLIVVHPDIFFGPSGQFHAVWTTTDADGFGGPGYYANLNLENLQTSKQSELDTPGIKTPSVIEYDGNIIVGYYHHRVNGNFWRISKNNGQTWSVPALISPIHKGTNGVVSFVIDSSNQLHVFFGERIDANNHGMWHCIWRENRWSTPEPVVKGPQIVDQIGGDGFDPRSARAIIANGNHLLVTWGTDGFAGENGAWYSYKILDTPGLPLIPLPQPENNLSETDSPGSVRATPTVITTTIPPDSINLSNNDPEENSSPLLSPISVGLFSSILIVAVTLISRKIMKR